MQTMHFVTCPAQPEARNHAEIGDHRADWTPGGQGVAGSNPVSPTEVARKLKGFRDTEGSEI